MTTDSGFDIRLTPAERAAVRNIDIYHRHNGVHLHWRDADNADVIAPAFFTSSLFVDFAIVESGFPALLTRFSETDADGEVFERRVVL